MWLHPIMQTIYIPVFCFSRQLCTHFCICFSSTFNMCEEQEQTNLFTSALTTRKQKRLKNAWTQLPGAAHKFREIDKMGKWGCTSQHHHVPSKFVSWWTASCKSLSLMCFCGVFYSNIKPNFNSLLKFINWGMPWWKNISIKQTFY